MAEYDSESITLNNGEYIYLAKEKYGEYKDIIFTPYSAGAPLRNARLWTASGWYVTVYLIDTLK